MAAPDRKEVVRIDCDVCFGAGFQTLSGGGERPCSKCDGLGMLERSVPYDPGLEGGKRSPEQLRGMFGVANPTNKPLDDKK